MDIWDLQFDEENVDHLARHGLTARRVFQVLNGEEYVTARNRTSSSGQIKMIGPDYGGQLWTVVLVLSDQHGVWRPVTGWQSTRGEITIYRNRR